MCVANARAGKVAHEVADGQKVLKLTYVAAVGFSTEPTHGAFM